MYRTRGHQLMLWQHTVSGLHLRVDGRTHAVPRRLAEQLLDTDVDGLSPDPHTDLLDLERRIRLCALTLIGELQDADRCVARARVARDLASRRTARRARRSLRMAITTHTAVVFDLEQIGHDFRGLRRFINGLPAREGRLAAAIRGWRLSAYRPGYVVTFPGEAAFVRADPRRAVRAGWGGTVIAGSTYGSTWRRDGDEDPREPDVDLAGPWSVGYIPATREVYAHRLCPHLPETVWLLASDMPTAIAHQLRALQRRMPQPNSLLLLARTVHAHSRTSKSRFDNTPSRHLLALHGDEIS